MPISLEQKLSLIQPGTIWKRKVNGSWERAYIERLESRLLLKGQGQIDIRTAFGEEHIPKKKFLAQFTFLGWAKTRLEDLLSDQNIIPSISDPKLWRK